MLFRSYTAGEALWNVRRYGLGQWTEPRCPVASISGTTITMAQPCWDNSTKRVIFPNIPGRTINMVGPGTALVRVDVIDSPTPIQTIRPSLDYTLQVGSFSQLENAQQLRDRLAKSFTDVTIAPTQSKDLTYYRVHLGTFSTRADAEEQARHVSQAGYSVIIMEK